MLLDELKAARKGKGLSRSALAALLSVDPQLIKRLEVGSGSVPLLIAIMREIELHLTGIGNGSTLPDQLKARRKALGLTITAAATRAGITRSTLAALERGQGTVAPLLKVLAALAPKAGVAKPIRTSFIAHRDADRDSRFTPVAFLDALTRSFGPIDLDPCWHPASPVEAQRTISPPDDGLAASWFGSRLTFINPPFSNLTAWIDRAISAYDQGECERIVVLIPTRTDSASFHAVTSRADVGFLKGRMKFTQPDGSTYSAPFAMMCLVFGATVAEVDDFALRLPSTWLRRQSSPSAR